MPKVSVISAVHNVGSALTRCLESLSNQTLNDIEMIFVDDCSTDDSLAILQKWAEKDKRLKVIALKENRGAAVARNAGLTAAQESNPEYLGFVDPDDSVDLEYYESLYNAATADNQKRGIAKAIIEQTTLDGKIIRTDMNNRLREKGLHMFTHEWTTAIYQYDLIKKNNIMFPPECVKSQDIVFLSRIINAMPRNESGLIDPNSYALIDTVRYNYYRRPNSLDAKKIPMRNYKSALRAVELVLTELKESNPETLYERYQWRYTALIRHNLFQNDSPEAKQLAADAIIRHFHDCPDVARLNNYMQETFPFIADTVANRENDKLVAQLLRCPDMKALQARKPVDCSACLSLLSLDVATAAASEKAPTVTWLKKQPVPTQQPEQRMKS